MTGSLCLEPGKPRWLVTGTCKRLSFVDIRTLGCLSKYIFFRERKCNDILERQALKIYMLKILRINRP